MNVYVVMFGMYLNGLLLVYMFVLFMCLMNVDEVVKFGGMCLWVVILVDLMGMMVWCLIIDCICVCNYFVFWLDVKVLLVDFVKVWYLY